MTTLPLEGDMMAMMRGRPSEPMTVIEQLQQLDQVKPLASDIDAIPADIDVLMLVHPQKLPEKTLFAIDQFVLKGGKALVFVDPLSELQASHPSQFNPPGSPTSSNLDRLFKSWGFEVLSDTVVGDRRDAQRVGVPVPGGGSTRPLDYIAWLNLHAANLNRDDMITADLSHIVMASAGIIEPLDGAKTTIEPLITTSPQLDQDPGREVGRIARCRGPPRPIQVGQQTLHPRRPCERHGRHRLSGRPAKAAGARQAAGDGKTRGDRPTRERAAEAKPPSRHRRNPPSRPTAPAAAAAEWIKTSAQPINIVVVADTDMLDDRFWVQTQDFFGQRITMPTANNGDFVANAVEVLAGGNDLVGLRSRGTSARPFDVVDQIERDAQERYSAEERALQQKLKDTEAKLADLTGKDQANAPTTLSPEQTKTIEGFRADMLQTRRQLRAVQAALRSEIGRLKTGLEFLDIALIPIIVAVVAVVLGAVRLKRRSRRTVEG